MNHCCMAEVFSLNELRQGCWEESVIKLDGLWIVVEGSCNKCKQITLDHHLDQSVAAWMEKTGSCRYTRKMK